MYKAFIAMISIAFLLVPVIAYSQSEQTQSKAPPPVSQQLVPEGDFAIKLADALKLGTPTSEAHAEDILTSAGISPKSGWIANYPVTPDVIGQLHDAVGAAADSKKLPMTKEEALKALQDVAGEFGLAVSPGDSDKYGDKYAEGQPQPDPAVVDNYYYEEGPPVVTYYPPPPDYYYLYSWVPYPFWWTGFHFHGFFILHDFHKTVFIGHHKHFVTSHFFDHKTKRGFVVDPVGRRNGEAFRVRDASRGRGFHTPEARRGAESILQRNRERAGALTSGRGSGSNQFVGPRTGGRSGRSEGQRFTNRGSNSQPFNSGRDRSVRQSGNSGGRNEMNFRSSSPREGRSSGGPGVSGGRSFNSPSTSTGGRSFRSSGSSGRSFGAPTRSFSAPSRGSSSFSRGGSSSFSRGGGGSSFRSSSGGGSSRGGGFSGGGSSRGGGFSGGRGGGGRGR